MNPKEYIQAIKPIIDRTYSIKTDTNKGAVIVETRQIENYGLIVKNHLHFMPKGWGLTVFCAHGNESYVREQLDDVIGVNYCSLGDVVASTTYYNHLLTNNLFWNLVPYEKVLIFQTDSLLLRKGLEQFELYDYIGAPWINRSMPAKGGNGGLSIRTKSKTIETINKFHYNTQAHGNEDVFYSLNMNGNIANKEMGMRFSVETIFNPKPIGYHAAEKYLPQHQISEILINSFNEL